MALTHWKRCYLPAVWVLLYLQHVTAHTTKRTLYSNARNMFSPPSSILRSRARKKKHMPSSNKKERKALIFFPRLCIQSKEESFWTLRCVFYFIISLKAISLNHRHFFVKKEKNQKFIRRTYSGILPFFFMLPSPFSICMSFPSHPLHLPPPTRFSMQDSSMGFWAERRHWGLLKQLLALSCQQPAWNQAGKSGETTELFTKLATSITIFFKDLALFCIFLKCLFAAIISCFHMDNWKGCVVFRTGYIARQFLTSPPICMHLNVGKDTGGGGWG